MLSVTYVHPKGWSLHFLWVSSLGKEDASQTVLGGSLKPKGPKQANGCWRMSICWGSQNLLLLQAKSCLCAGAWHSGCQPRSGMSLLALGFQIQFGSQMYRQTVAWLQRATNSPSGRPLPAQLPPDRANRRLSSVGWAMLVCFSRAWRADGGCMGFN